MTCPLADPRIAFFDGHAPTWDTTGQDGSTAVARLVELADLLDLTPGQRVLEVGCGTGQITGHLARCVRPGRVTAVDFAPAMLAVARSKGIDADFVELDVCRPELSDKRRFAAGTFDVVLCFHSFPHFRDQRAALRNLACWMKPTGRLIVMHLAGGRQINHFHAGLSGAVNGDVLPTGDDWPPLLAEVGLRQVRLIDRDGLFFLDAGMCGPTPR